MTRCYARGAGREDLDEAFTAAQLAGPLDRGDQGAGRAVGWMGLGGESMQPFLVGRRQRGDLFEHCGPDTFIGADHLRRLATPRDLHLDHVAALEGPVIGQGLEVLIGAHRGQLIQLAAGYT